MDPLPVCFLTCFVVFLLVIYSCSLSIHLLLNHFNVVVANGHGDVEMWTIESSSRPCKLYDAHDTAIGLELEEAFTLNVGRREETSDSIQVIEATAYFIHNYRTLNVRVL